MTLNVEDVHEVHLYIKDHAVVTNIDGDIQHAHNFNLIMDTISGPVLNCTENETIANMVHLVATDITSNLCNCSFLAHNT